MEELDKSTFSHPVTSLPGVTGTSRRWWESMESSRPPASPLRLSASSTIQKKLSPPTTCTVLPGSACTLSAPLSIRSGAAPTSMDRWIENGWMDGSCCVFQETFVFYQANKITKSTRRTAAVAPTAGGDAPSTTTRAPEWATWPPSPQAPSRSAWNTVRTLTTFTGGLILCVKDERAEKMLFHLTELNLFFLSCSVSEPIQRYEHVARGAKEMTLEVFLCSRSGGACMMAHHQAATPPPTGSCGSLMQRHLIGPFILKASSHFRMISTDSFSDACVKSKSHLSANFEDISRSRIWV